jgi:hypothetical protein
VRIRQPPVRRIECTTRVRIRSGFTPPPYRSATMASNGGVAQVRAGHNARRCRVATTRTGVKGLKRPMMRLSGGSGWFRVRPSYRGTWASVQEGLQGLVSVRSCDPFAPYIVYATTELG